jgi:hypothetical protein
LAYILDQLGQSAEQTLQLGAIICLCQLLCARELIRWKRDRWVGATHHAQHHQIASALQELTREVQQIEPLVSDRSHALQARGGVAREQRFDRAQHALAACDRQAARDVFAVQLGIAQREHLVEHGQRIAHRAGGFACDQRDCRVVGVDLLRSQDRAHAFCDHRVRDQPEIIALAARANRDRYLVDLGRREHELHVRGRLFQRLQERVECARREHVNFIHDHDLEAIARGSERQCLLETPHIVDAVVGGAVDLQHVDVIAGRDLAALITHVAGGCSRPLLAVQRFRE